MKEFEVEMAFSQAFAMEIAGDWEPPENVCARHGVALEDYEELKLYEPFALAVASYKKTMFEAGVTTEMRARVSVQDLIPTMHRLVKDEEIPAQVRKGCFDSLVALSNLAGSANAGAGPGATINIVFPEATSAPRDVTPDLDLSVPTIELPQ